MVTIRMHVALWILVIALAPQVTSIAADAAAGNLSGGNFSGTTRRAETPLQQLQRGLSHDPPRATVLTGISNEWTGAGRLLTRDAAPVPVAEPSTLVLLGSSLAVVALWGGRRKKRQG